MGKFLCVLSILLLAACSVSAQEAAKPGANTPAAGFKIPPEASKLANPVKPTPASLSQGKKVYDVDCAVCHGEDGDGKGDLAADMKSKLADYHDPSALKDFTDEISFTSSRMKKAKCRRKATAPSRIQSGTW